jgi:hypothetical protein
MQSTEHRAAVDDAHGPEPRDTKSTCPALSISPRPKKTRRKYLAPGPALALVLIRGGYNAQRTRGAEEKRRKTRRTYLLFLRSFEIFRSNFDKHFCGGFGLVLQRTEKTKGGKKSPSIFS